MSLNSRLKDNATVLILHKLQMSIELSNQSGEYDVGTIIEIASVISLNILTDNVKESYHNITSDYIPLWNDRPVGNFGSGSSTAFFCPLSDLALSAIARHDFAKNNKKYLPKNNNTKDIRFC
jgi:hypothetical protein